MTPTETADEYYKQLTALKKENKQLEKEHKEMRIVLQQAHDVMKKLTASTAALLEELIQKDKFIADMPTPTRISEMNLEITALKKEIKERDRK